MTDVGPDLLETTAAAAAGATRRLTTKEKVKTAASISVTTWDTLLDQLIDILSDDCAGYCNLATDTAGAFATFGAETLRATWYPGSVCDDTLLLPWRPKLAIAAGAVVEDGVVLVAGTDYRFRSTGMGGELQRICGGYPTPWAFGTSAVITLTAGWTLPTGVPPRLEGQVIEQVRMGYQTRNRDRSIRSIDIPDLYAATFNTTGGLASSNLAESGLLYSLEAVLQPYRLETI